MSNTDNKNMILPELLAPAGGSQHFIAACENGADAVYFGGKGFNARALADNFEYEDMKEAIAYAHSKKVKAYMTLNTLVRQDELKDALKQAELGLKAGVDAFIVQDMGLVRALKKNLPDAVLHLSTQGTVYDRAGLEFAREAGFKRAVLARELSLEEIQDCTSVKGIETEVFVHGALCMCLSGQCAMSSLIGDRSGNRGTCAQPCRKTYSLTDDSGFLLGETGYILSPKDISYLANLGDLIKAGVTSLKIEGRMKTPEYTGLAAASFRKYLDMLAASNNPEENISPEREDVRRLEQMFSRGGFSTAYLYGRKNAAILSGESPKHRGLFLGAVKSVKPSRVNREKSVITLELRQDISLGDGVEIMANRFPGGVVTYIRGRNGNLKRAGAGDSVTIGDIPGKIAAGDLVYKVSDSELNKAVRKTFEKASTKPAANVKAENEEKIKIKGRFIAAEGRPLLYTVYTEEGIGADAGGKNPVEVAKTAPVSEDQVLKQLKKTGGTPFILDTCDIVLKGDLMIPVSEINRVRRAALEKLEKKMTK